jgi:amino acid adenylation domain-containing protein
LRAITRHRATTSGGPNFAYDLCVDKITSEEKQSLDLSSWRVAFNGSEPLRPETLERFAAAFGPCGFRRESFHCCYGLAEATLFVTGARQKSSFPICRAVDARELERNRVAEVSLDGGQAAVLVSSGRADAEQRLIIVDPETLTHSQFDRVGEIWVSGRSVAQGYWNHDAETERTFRAHLADTGEGPFLRTGDLGFLQDGELFVTGRLKDLIIIRGLNYYPQDIELTIEHSHQALRPNSGAAFSIEFEGRERLVVVQEVASRFDDRPEEVIEAIRRSIAENHEVQVHAVCLLRRGSLPKTSSGKIQRHACRAGFLNRTLDVVAEWCDDAGFEDLARTKATPVARQSLAGIQEWLIEELALRLRIDPAGVDVNRRISEYGLDSLAAVELTHNLQTAFGKTLPITSFLHDASVAEIVAAAVRQTSEPQIPMASFAANDGPEVETLGLSTGQQALWFLHELDPVSAAYHIATAVHIRGELDAGLLRRAFQALVTRHPALRTSFAVHSGVTVQQVHRQAEVPFKEEDATDWTDAAVNTRLAEEAKRPFDLTRCPLMTVTLLTRGPEDRILLLVLHHIIADLWSLAVLARDLGTLYAAQKTGRAASLGPPSAQYADFVSWQDGMAAGGQNDSHWEYWRNELSGELPALNLRTDRPRPRLQSYAGASHSFMAGTELTGRLKAIARAQRTTLYTILLAAFQVLLHRYTGQTDILVGSPAAGRSLAAWADVVGYFVNPVVLRAGFDDDPTFEEVLALTRRAVTDALDHQDYPFPTLVKRLNAAHDPSRSPLFQAMFILQRQSLPSGEDLSALALGEKGVRIRLGELELESFGLKQRTAQFDLVLGAAETREGLRASLQYNTDLFLEPTIKRFADHYLNLLESIVSDPQVRVTQLSITTAKERHQLLVELNQSGAVKVPEKCLHQFFERQSELTPDAEAIVAGDERLTYKELNERANQLAHYLIEQGVKPETNVPILVRRNVDMLIGVLGILKAGGAYVPLDTTYPRSRIELVLEDMRPVVAVTEAALAERLEGAARLVYLDRERDAPGRYSRKNPAVSVSPRNLAYVIYTSGSTGRPKGVAIEHKSAATLLCWARGEYSSAETAVVLASTSLCFDLSVFELFVPLSVGGKVVMAENALQLPELGAGDEVTLVNTVPSALRELLRGGVIGRHVRAINLAGEPLPQALVALSHEHASAARVVNLYGPTEATTYSTFATVARGEDVTIGRPIRNTQVYILDRHLQPVPTGVTGDLYIGGDGLARGYFGRPDLTAEKFIPDLFGSGGGRLYRTGDLASYRDDGRIEYRGRVDGQVKLRGYRIETAEIEAVLSQHAAVREALVSVQEARDDKALVGYVVLRNASATSIRELREFLEERLPAYMVPSTFVFLEEMPLTPNGKVDRRALPAVRLGTAGTGRKHLKPRSPVEEILAGLWTEVLGVEEIGANDNFFDLGGHSLNASQLIHRVRETFQCELSLRSFYEVPTPAAMSSTMLRDDSERMRIQRIAELIQSVARMSEQEVQDLLDGETSSQLKRDRSNE